MAQIKTGTVSVTNGSNVVTGSGTQFLTEGVVVGSAFIIQTSEGIDGAGVLYTIGGSITESGFQLSSNWAGDTASGLAFVVHVDMLAAGFYQLLPGDLEVKTIFNYNITKLINDKAALTALGSAAFANLTTSPTDTTAGRVTRVADGGLLRDSNSPLVTVSDANLHVAGGSVYLLGSGLNNPLGVACQLFNISSGGPNNNISQFAFVDTSTQGSKLIYYRTRINGVWEPTWQRFYTTNNVTASAQNLLANGSYNLGQTGLQMSEETVLFNDRKIGFVLFASANTGGPNFWKNPTDVSRSIGLTMQGRTGDREHVLVFKDGNPSPRIVYQNQSDGGSTEGPTELYHERNILGTVSQSGGVPTGAIIERGSDSNSEWTKYADGSATIIIKIVVDMTATTFGSAQAQTETVPFSLTTSPYLSVPAHASIESADPPGDALDGVTGIVANVVSNVLRIWVRNAQAGQPTRTCIFTINGYWY